MLIAMKFAYEIADAIRTKRISARAVTETALARAEAVQKDLNAFITIAKEHALTQADALDARLAAADSDANNLPLCGVPVVIKDNINTKGIRSTAGSKSLDTFIPPYSATVVERLVNAGAIIIAKSNLDEFGMGGSNENSAYGATKNPWDASRVPGGSSGGSAVAVATGVAPIALGTDTGGSVRQPASFTGIIGFKPTYGRLSRYGVTAFASSLDQVGVLCRSSRDLALVMDVMGGHDPMDGTSIEHDTPAFLNNLSDKPDLTGLRIGVINELADEGNSDGVKAALTAIKTRLTELGATVGDVSLPNAPYGIATYYLVAPAEASSNLARFDGMVYSTRVGENNEGQASVMMQSRGASFGKEVRRRILMGTYALSAGYYDAYYGKALKVRQLIANDFSHAFESFDILMSPTAPTVAFPLGAKTNDPLAMYLGDIDTCLANLVGTAAISVPAGQAEHGLPCGVQFFAPVMQDERLITLSSALELQSDEFAPLSPYQPA